MSFAAPGFLIGGAVAALAILALHFLVRRQPERWELPTARFIPDTKELAPARSLALEDRLLLLLRVLALAALALGFARPVFHSGRVPLARIILADLGPAVADPAVVRRLADSLRSEADRVIEVRDGSLSSALVRGIREAHALRDEADSVGLVLVSPLVREELDAATLAIRSTWPGGIPWRPVAAAEPLSEARALDLRATTDDPIRATLALGGWEISPAAPVRLVRDGALAASDSAWAGGGRLLLHWPESTASAGDTIGAVITPRTVLVARFVRNAEPGAGVPIAWWADGRAAAVESTTGSGCIRSVRVPLAVEGDLALRGRLREVLRDLLVPCGGARDLRPADSATVRAIRGTARMAVATSGLASTTPADPGAMPWLLGLGLALLIAEQVLRRRSHGG